MIRLATNNLLILVVLICPYQCLGESVLGALEPHQEVACCCGEQQDASNDQAPALPHDCDEDCLCRGAICDASRTTDHELAATAVVLWTEASAMDLSRVGVCLESPHQFPPFSTGRDVCALTCTLQL